MQPELPDTGEVFCLADDNSVTGHVEKVRVDESRPRDFWWALVVWDQPIAGTPSREWVLLNELRRLDVVELERRHDELVAEWERGWKCVCGVWRQRAATCICGRARPT